MIDLECLKANYDVEGWRVITDNWTKSNVLPGAILAINALIEEVEKLRVNEKDSKSVIQKWAAERLEMVANRQALVEEIERLRSRAMCGCGDGFTEHDPGTCGNCLASMQAGYKNDEHPKGDF